MCVLQFENLLPVAPREEWQVEAKGKGSLNQLERSSPPFFSFFSLPSILPWVQNLPHQSSENI